MKSQRDTIKRPETQPSKLNPKATQTPKTTGKIKDDVIYAKDKSPDDLEILD